jgi:hypothetical protein
MTSKRCFFFKFGFGFKESIVSAPPDYNSDQLFKSNFSFCVVCVFNLQFEESVFLRRVVHSQSTHQRQLLRQIKKKTPLPTYLIEPYQLVVCLSCHCCQI